MVSTLSARHGFTVSAYSHSRLGQPQLLPPKFKSSYCAGLQFLL